VVRSNGLLLLAAICCGHILKTHQVLQRDICVTVIVWYAILSKCEAVGVVLVWVDGKGMGSPAGHCMAAVTNSTPPSAAAHSHPYFQSE
jgi:hypothetical protein